MTSPNNRPLRIVFADPSSNGRWIAGIHYLKNLLVAVHALELELQPELGLLVSPEAPADSFQPLTAYLNETLPMSLRPPKPGIWQRRLTRLKKRLGLWQEPEPALSRYLRERQTDAIFVNSREFGPKFRIPLLSWIPDFQHLHLPDMFTAAENDRRTKDFTRIANFAARVIVSSQDARRDLEQFAPQAAPKARVLPFVVQIPETIYDVDPGQVSHHYHLPQRFVYLPNQFWKHKNHSLVLEALRLVVGKHPEIAVVCSGSTGDYRNPYYFGELLATVSNLNLRPHFIILGTVPHEHVIQLMRQSLALLQPSLFEGWSTTVEEAKSIGKQVILSNLPVHREQDPPEALFFDPREPEALAECLVTAFDHYSPGPDGALEEEARHRLPARTRQFGRTFIEIAQEAVLTA